MRSILLVDDSVTVRRIVDLAFRDVGVLVDAVASGPEALERFRSSRPDLVLADVGMPDPDGYAVCREVKDSDHPVPVLLLRSSFEPFDATLAEECGADGTVAKPFEADRLVERVRAMLDPQVDRAEDRGGPTEEPAQDVEAEEAFGEIVGAADATASGEEPTSDGAVASPTIAAHAEEASAVPVRVLSDDAPEGAGTPPTGASMPGATPPGDVVSGMTDEQIDALADRIVRRLSDRVVREIAWEVVPDLASAMIRERLREIEGDDTDVP